MGIFDGIGDVAHNLSHGLFGDEEHKRIPAPKGGELGPRLPMFSPGFSPDSMYPQSSRPLPPKAANRLKQYWEQAIPWQRPYFRVADKPLSGGVLAYTVWDKHNTPAIVFDPNQAKYLSANPRSPRGQYAMLTALHEMAHVAQGPWTGRVPKQKNAEPGAEAYSQVEYPFVSQDVLGYMPKPGERDFEWRHKAYPGQVNRMMKDLQRGFKGNLFPLPPQTAKYLREGQFGLKLTPAQMKKYGIAATGPRAYSMNTPGPAPYFTQPPKTPWSNLHWDPQGY